jgi:hypothetical protein
MPLPSRTPFADHIPAFRSEKGGVSGRNFRIGRLIPWLTGSTFAAFGHFLKSIKEPDFWPCPITLHWTSFLTIPPEWHQTLDSQVFQWLANRTTE